MIKVAIVEDHGILRKTLALLIKLLPGLEMSMEAGDGCGFIKNLTKHTLPDIVLMDISMPNMDGVQTTLWLKQNHPSVKVIALSMLTNELVLMRMIRNGARGYLLKDIEPEELHKAVNQVYRNGYYYNELFTPGYHATKKTGGLDIGKMLNEQELIFLRWACTELSLKQIAAKMGVSPRTVDGYRDALFRKLQVSSRIGIVLYALNHQIVIL
jgi:DNA-binding NarL/FixJ family response regulator